MPRRSTFAPASSRLLPATVLLVLALLWAQALGLAHGVLHAGPLAHEAVAAQAVKTVQAAPAPGLLAHLLAPADDADECRLYDQLGHAGLLTLLPTLTAAAAPLLAGWAVLPALRPQPCAAFSARAPPLSR